MEYQRSLVSNCPFSGHGFSAGIKVAKNAWKTVSLTKHIRLSGNRSSKNSLTFRGDRRPGHTFIDREHLTMTMSVTLPLALPEGVSWHQVLDRAFKDRESSTRVEDLSGP